MNVLELSAANPLPGDLRMLEEIVASLVIDNPSDLPRAEWRPTVTDLDEMYWEWFQYYPDQGDIVREALERTSALPWELIIAALTRLQSCKHPSAIQECFWQKALTEKAGDLSGLMELLPYWAEDVQRKEVVDLILKAGVSSLPRRDLLKIASHVKDVVPDALLQELVRRVMESEDWGIEPWSIEALCRLYTLCVKRRKEEHLVRSVITRKKIAEMAEGNTYAVCGTILDSVPVGSPLWNSCLHDVDDVLPEVAAPKNDVARQQVAEMAARIRRQTLRLDGTVPPLQLYANLLDALEGMVSTREEAVSYWLIVRKDREEDPDRWARACTLVREHSKEPEPEGAVPVPG